MCKRKNRRIDVAVTWYKIFLVLLMLAQLYDIFFITLNVIEIMIHCIILLYLMFRYYILDNTAKKAHNQDFSLTEFLNDRMDCKKGNHYPDCDCFTD